MFIASISDLKGYKSVRMNDQTLNMCVKEVKEGADPQSSGLVGRDAFGLSSQGMGIISEQGAMIS
jgi:hypothetical protein